MAWVSEQAIKHLLYCFRNALLTKEAKSSIPFEILAAVNRDDEKSEEVHSLIKDKVEEWGLEMCDSLVHKILVRDDVSGALGTASCLNLFTIDAYTRKGACRDVYTTNIYELLRIEHIGLGLELAVLSLDKFLDMCQQCCSKDVGSRKQAKANAASSILLGSKSDSQEISNQKFLNSKSRMNGKINPLGKGSVSVVPKQDSVDAFKKSGIKTIDEVVNEETKEHDREGFVMRSKRRITKFVKEGEIGAAIFAFYKTIPFEAWSELSKFEDHVASNIDLLNASDRDWETS